MKTKTSELIGPALNYAAAKADGWQDIPQGNGWMFHPDGQATATLDFLNYSGDWALGGPIIERERIECTPPILNDSDKTWMSVQVDDDNIGHLMVGDTTLIAAMRAFVASKLGDEVDIPEELL